MSDDRTDRIRRRAHAIWEHEGRPDGRDADHWSRAEADIGTDGADGEATAQPAACAVEPGPVQDSRRRTRAAPKARRKDATPPVG